MQVGVYSKNTTEFLTHKSLHARKEYKTRENAIVEFPDYQIPVELHDYQIPVTHWCECKREI